MKSTFSLLCMLATTLAASTPHGTLSKPDACVSACNAAKDKCYSQPSHNATVCGGEYVKCIGYEPTLDEPTTCRSASTATTTATTTASSKPDACVSACNAAKDKCYSQPSHNATVCGGEYVKCIGYEPTLDEPTTCRSASTATTTTTASSKPDACVRACNAAKDKCYSQPSYNATVCGDEYVKCIGYEPTLDEPTTCQTKSVSTPTGKHDIPVVTAAATYVSPAVWLLLGLGVVALF